MKFLNRKSNSEEDVDTQSPGVASRVLGLLSFSFVDLTGEAMDLVSHWNSTRRWYSVLLMLPVVLICGVMGSLIAIGKLSPARDKVKWYVDLADDTIQLASKGGTKSESEPENKEKIAFVDAMFQRVLQLENSNKHALFHVAYQMSRFGKVAAARPIIESLAPTKNGGFEPAHAWLAYDMIQRGQKGEPIDTAVLKHHLKHGTASENANPGLLVFYVQLLQRDEQNSEAEQVLKKAGKFEPKLLINSIAAYTRSGMMGQAKSAADMLFDSVKDHFIGEKGDDHLILAAQAYAMTNRLEQGVELLQSGLKQRPESPKLRRAMSNAMRLVFRSTASSSQNQVKVNLDHLNMAIALDPTNFAVQEEITLLAKVGIGQNEATLDELRTQIAANGTSYIARLLIADASLRKRDLGTAVNQYEVILAGLPTMTLAMNNLAMGYTMLEQPKLEDALRIIDKAIAISPEVAEFHDTRAEILVATDRKKEAIDSYLAALVRIPEREQTREKLIKLYDELGPPEQAEKQRQLLAQVRKLIQERLEQQQTASSTKTDAPSATPIDAIPNKSE